MDVRSKGERTREHILATSEALVLSRGYVGTSLDDILRETGLSKGAFFNHFRSKADLAQALVERYARNDYDLFEGFSRQADAETADPLERLFAFLKKFEAHLEALGAPPPGCVFAAYTYEIRQFEPAVETFIRDGFRAWSALYEEKFAAALAARAPIRPVTAAELAEMVMSIVEGGFILARSYDDAGFLIRQLRQFRHYVEMLLATDDPRPASPAA